MNCHFDSIFFWWMNCHFCSIGSSFFMDALLFWLQLSLGMNCHFEPIFCMDELPFLLHGFSFLLHLFYGLIANFGSIFFIDGLSFWLHLFYQQSSIQLYHKIEQKKYWLYWRLKREFSFHFMRKINLECKVGVGGWLPSFDVLICIWTLSQVEGTTNFGKGPK